MDEQVKNPLMDKLRLPGETFSLPSKGLFYKNGELGPGVKQGEVHIYPMTTIDEIVMRSPDKLFNGEAAREVIGRCVPQVHDAFNLLAKDVDFIMLCLRKVSYGSDIEVFYTHNCKDAKEHSYVLKANDFIKKTKQIDPMSLAQLFEVNLDNGQHVKFRPMLFSDSVEMLQSLDKEMSDDDIKNSIVKSLSNVIESVDNVTNSEFIKEWAAALPVKYKQRLTEVIQENSDWGPDFVTVEKCKDCGGNIELEPPINPISFFY